MHISIASDSDQKLWDDVVHSSDEGTLFHTWKWLKVLEKHSVKKIFYRSYKGILYPLIIWEGNEIIGLIPIYFFNSKFFKLATSPPSSAEYHTLGPIMNKNTKPIKSHRKQNLFFQFQNTLDNFLKKELKSNYISIISSPGISDPRPFLWSGYQAIPQFTNIIDLREGEQKLWENVNQSVRKSVNKATKNGISVEEGSKSDIEYLFSLLKSRNRIHSAQTFLPDIFENFYPNNLNFFIAKKDGIPLTGLINTLFKNKISSWVGSPKVSVDGLSPNFILYWETMRWACQNNFDLFENISANEPTTFPFKSKFNPEIVPYYRFNWYSPLPHFVKSVYMGIFHENY
jgi:hypothetical protein